MCRGGSVSDKGVGIYIVEGVQKWEIIVFITEFETYSISIEC